MPQCFLYAVKVSNKLGAPMKKKTRATGTVKYRFSVLKMAGKFSYVIESEGPKKFTFLP